MKDAKKAVGELVFVNISRCIYSSTSWNLQVFSNNKVTNVNVCTKNKPSFILRELYFIFEVVSVF